LTVIATESMSVSAVASLEVIVSVSAPVKFALPR
jgi:hypothetical protein